MHRPASSSLASTLFGEYLAMLLVLHSVVIIAAWGASPEKTTFVAAISLIAPLWVTVRALGFGSEKAISLLISIALLATCYWTLTHDSVPQSAVRVISIRVLAVMLIIVVWVDLTEFHRKNVTNLSGRLAMGHFMMRHGLRILWLGLTGLIVVYALLTPLLEEWQWQQTMHIDARRLAMDRMTLQQSILFRFCESITAVFFFVVGTCVGSFLNVVIYRVPQRISVLVKPSHCPGCSENIMGRDNLPIVGWLNIKGCCRHCKIAISSRYPTVELAIGLVFLVLYFVELISGGTNLPGRPPKHYTGVLWILFYTKWDLVGLYLFHCLLMCTLFSWAMIRRDGHQVPRSSVLFMFTIIAVPTFFWPHLQPYPGLNTEPLYLSQTYSAAGAAITSSLGLLAGLCLTLLSKTISYSSGGKIVPDDISSWMLLGLALGWQAACGVFFLSLVWQSLCIIQRSVFDAKRRTPVATDLNFAFPWIVLFHHCVWRSVIELVTEI